MVEHARREISETVEVLVVELRGIAQPHEIAQFRELALDAADAEAPDQLAKIATQIESLKAFCLSRALSGAAHELSLPVKGKRA
jgi:hypothetical protein